MSISSKINGDSFDVDSLAEIEARCRELREEKNLIKESQSQSFELIRRLDLHVKTLTDSRSGDKIRIQELERELRNCSQEIDFLQDELNARDTEFIYLREQVHSFVPKQAELKILQDEVDMLRKKLVKSDSEQMILLEELENKEAELLQSTAVIEKLEESLSFAMLESQCEIESMKLEIMALGKNFFEAKKVREDTVKEKDKINMIVQDLEDEHLVAQKLIVCLEGENTELRNMLKEYEINARVFCQKFGQQFKEWVEHKCGYPVSFDSLFSEVMSKEMSKHSQILGTLLSQVAVVPTPDAIMKFKMEEMSHQIHEYELLVHKLKENLRVEKVKAKDEAEDLTQEMAELRYQYTGMLEEESKRRACIEQASLQRIAELEGQILKEERKSILAEKSW